MRIRKADLSNLKQDIWSQQAHDLHSSVVDYQGDSDPNYVVEPYAEADLHNPKSLVQMRKKKADLSNLKQDIWSQQAHDLHSSVVDYQGDSDPNYVVEPYAEADLHNPKSLVQYRRRTLPDTPYTLPNGNKGTYDGHSVDGMVGDEALGEAPVVGGSAVSVA